MAYPPGVTQATITAGSAIGWFGEPVAKLTVSITPVIGGNVVQLVHRATGTSMYVTTRTWTDEGTGIVTFTLPHVDQRGWFDGTGKEVMNWAYKANITATFAGGNQKSRPFAFQVFSDQDEVDLDLIEDGQVTAPVGAVVPAVTSVNGQTGAVVIEAGEGGGSVDLSGYATLEDLESLASRSDVMQLLTGKADADHTHQTADVMGLDDALSSKADAAHSHPELEQRIEALEDAPTGGAVTLVESPEGSGLYEIQGV